MFKTIFKLVFDKTLKDAHIVLTKIYRLQMHKKISFKTVQ